jgi:hypothetical protein
MIINPRFDTLILRSFDYAQDAQDAPYAQRFWPDPATGLRAY